MSMTTAAVRSRLTVNGVGVASIVTSLMAVPFLIRESLGEELRQLREPAVGGASRWVAHPYRKDFCVRAD
jgi:hypothetical protein